MLRHTNPSPSFAHLICERIKLPARDVPCILQVSERVLPSPRALPTPDEPPLGAPLALHIRLHPSRHRRLLWWNIRDTKLRWVTLNTFLWCAINRNASKLHMQVDVRIMRKTLHLAFKGSFLQHNEGRCKK